MRFISKVLKDTLHERFPDATEDELLKVSHLISFVAVLVTFSLLLGSVILVDSDAMFHAHVGESSDMCHYLIYDNYLISPCIHKIRLLPLKLFIS